MKLLHTLFEFKGDIPSLCNLRLGESYDEYYDLVSAVQDKRTGDTRIDYCLDEYDAFIDVIPDSNGRILELTLSFHPYLPFTISDMDKVVDFFKKAFNYTKYSCNTDEEGEEYEYDYSFTNKKYSISLHKDSHHGELRISIYSPQEDVIDLQGANIYYYHELLGIYGVKDSELCLSNTRHPGKLSREDVVENLMAAMERNNEYGEDWHYDYAYSFLHQEGMILPLEDESLLKDDDYIRQHAEEMTDVYGYRSGQAEDLLNRAGVGKPLIPLEEIFREELLEGEITNLSEYYEEISSEWTLMQVLPYMSLDY